MTRWKIILLPIFAAILIAASYFFAAVRRPGVAAPANRPPVDTSLAIWQKRIAQHPRSYIDYGYLAEAYARKARETGDAGYYQRAEQTLRAALAINPDYPPNLAQLASVLFAMHDFSGALDIARPLLGSARQPQVWAVYGDAQLALGNYTGAQDAYQKLAGYKASPAAYSRLAVLAEINGDPEQALSWMEMASDLAQQYGDYPESLAWYEYQVGELYFKSGELKKAKQHYARSLKLFDKYYLALAGLGKVAAAQDQYKTAIEFYKQATAILPQPDLLAYLGDLYMLSGDAERARLQYETVEYTGKLAQINRQIYNRQLANFYLDHDRHLDEALRLATAELEVRKDIFGYDTAAWAYYMNGNLAEAQRLIEKALQRGTRDARLYYHAGMIALASGQEEDARRYLSDALAINPNFDLLSASVAQKALEQLGADR